MDIIDYWANLKLELEKSINIAIERGNVDVEVLRTMKEMLGTIRVKERKDGGNY